MSEEKYESPMMKIINAAAKLSWVEKMALAEGYRKKADQDDTEAQFSLGVCYQYDIGVSDKKEGARLFRLAADKGHLPAQDLLAHCYEYGRGVKQDKKEGFRRFKLAADEGYPPTQWNVGYSYQYGIGVGQDERESVKYYKWAASQGYESAQNNLRCWRSYLPSDLRKIIDSATVFIKQNPEKIGIGFDKENKIVPTEYGIEPKLVSEYKKTADSGNAEAQFKFAFCYENGLGVEETDSNIALVYYKLAADQEYAPAQFRLSQCYENGELNLAKDSKKATRYFNASLCEESILEKAEGQLYGVFRFFSEPKKPRELYYFQNDLTTNIKLIREKPSIQEHYFCSVSK